jgi:(p)ppGpp synthase/HD superfamily hydrolase
MTALSENFDAALAWASRRHARQRRHNTATPYLSHLMATCAIVLEEGGDERLAIAALLHDVLEDTDTSRTELRKRFGDDVYRVVDDCTDADAGQRARQGWADRKRAHLDRMAGFTGGSLLVIAADKVCSLQSLVDDLARFGPAMFDRSARSAADLLQNYRDVHAVLRPALGGLPVVRRLETLIEQFANALPGRSSGGAAPDGLTPGGPAAAPTPRR